MTNLNVLPIDTIIGQLGKTYPNYADAKFVDEDILENEKFFTALTTLYLDYYKWDFPYLVSMQQEYKLKGKLSTGKIRGVVNCVRATAIKASTPKVDMPTVDSNRYAVTLGDKLRFFRVNSPTEGKWAGYTFIDELYGSAQALKRIPVKNQQARLNILTTIASDEDALARFGQELGICGMCGSPLTDELSREIGIGPTCRSK